GCDKDLIDGEIRVSGRTEESGKVKQGRIDPQLREAIEQERLNQKILGTYIRMVLLKGGNGKMLSIQDIVTAQKTMTVEEKLLLLPAPREGVVLAEKGTPKYEAWNLKLMELATKIEA